MKTVDIETLLRWAYRDELPKMAAASSMVAAVRSSWHAVSRFGELMAVVQEADVVNRWGLVPLTRAADDPHPDALAVADAVEALAACDVNVPESWNPLSDMGDLGAEGEDAVRRGIDRLAPRGVDGRRKLRDPLSRLIIRHALLGGGPAWEAEAPTRRMVMGANGQPRWFRRVACTTPGAFGPLTTHLEVDGFNPAGRRPFPGAYRKFELVPDPAPAIVERGEYELWFAALGLLVEALSGTLVQHVPMPCQRSPRPWDGAVSSGRVLPSLLAAPAAPERRHIRRKVAT